jgi:hypothetical protein
VLITDGFKLTTTGKVKDLHRIALQSGVKRSEYQSRYYNIQGYQVSALTALGAKLVTTEELEEVLKIKRCKN